MLIVCMCELIVYFQFLAFFFDECENRCLHSHVVGVKDDAALRSENIFAPILFGVDGYLMIKASDLLPSAVIVSIPQNPI